MRLCLIKIAKQYKAILIVVYKLYLKVAILKIFLILIYFQNRMQIQLFEIQLKGKNFSLLFNYLYFKQKCQSLQSNLRQKLLCSNVQENSLTHMQNKQKVFLLKFNFYNKHKKHKMLGMTLRKINNFQKSRKAYYQMQNKNSYKLSRVLLLLLLKKDKIKMQRLHNNLHKQKIQYQKQKHIYKPYSTGQAKMDDFIFYVFIISELFRNIQIILSISNLIFQYFYFYQQQNSNYFFVRQTSQKSKSKFNQYSILRPNKINPNKLNRNPKKFQIKVLIKVKKEIANKKSQQNLNKQNSQKQQNKFNNYPYLQLENKICLKNNMEHNNYPFSSKNSFLASSTQLKNLKKPQMQTLLSRNKSTQDKKNNRNQNFRSLFLKTFNMNKSNRVKTQNVNDKIINDRQQFQLCKNLVKKNVSNSVPSVKDPYSCVDGVKMKSLKFQYYYKNIKLSQQKQKANQAQQQDLRSSNIKFTRQFTSNLNQQMLQSMKKYLKKVQKSKSSAFNEKASTSTQFGLDVKGIETKRRNYAQQFIKIKSSKKQPRSYLLVIKKQRIKSLSSIDTTYQDKYLVKAKNTNLIQNVLCKRKINKTQSIKKKYSQHFSNEQKPLLKRFQGMIANSNLILASFKLKIFKQLMQTSKLTKKSAKFTYYIGYGNNKNLIRSIMKKRWWWSEVYEINQANFIWTQLKVNSVLDKIEQKKRSLISETCLKQNKMQSQQFDKQSFKLSLAQISSKDTNNNTEQIKQSQNIEQENWRLDNLGKNQISLTEKLNKSISKYNASHVYIKNLLKYQNSQKKQKIFHQNDIILLQLLTSNAQNSSQKLKTLSMPEVFHNHYRLNYMFGNKNALFCNLKSYFQFLNAQQQLYEIIPKTYYLEKTNKSGLKQFFNKEFLSLQSQRDQNKKQKNLWIIKPAQNSNRGQGISVHSTFQNIRKQICTAKTNTKFIVQKYLRHLFLYQKRKFDIRTYLVMITFGNTTKFFWYNQGYIRTSSQYYNLNDTQNIFIHLTNDAIQCDGEKYGKFQPGNKLSYSQFQRYLDVNYSKEKYSVDELGKQMKEITKSAVKAIYPRTKSSKVNFAFQLFGLDFLIDSNFKPWLLEINTNPCLQLGCSVLQRLIPRMLQNMFRLSLDSVFQPSSQLSKMSSYFIYDNIFQINRFQLIFDSNYDQNEAWMDYCQNAQQKIYADDNEVFQNDGEQVQIDI